MGSVLNGWLAIVSIFWTVSMKIGSSVDMLWPLLLRRCRRSFVICKKSSVVEFCLWYVDSRLKMRLFKIPGGWADCGDR